MLSKASDSQREQLVALGSNPATALPNMMNPYMDNLQMIASGQRQWMERNRDQLWTETQAASRHLQSLQEMQPMTDYLARSAELHAKQFPSQRQHHHLKGLGSHFADEHRAIQDAIPLHRHRHLALQKNLTHQEKRLQAANASINSMRKSRD